MAKFKRNSVGSLVLPPTPTTNTASGIFRLWTAFFGAAFRRKLFDSISCGGISCHRYHSDIDSIAVTPAAARASEKLKQGNARSEKLWDLLKLDDCPSPEPESAMETKRKEAALEELKRAVNDVQVEDLTKRKGGASRVRLLAKEDSEARGTLAMLGAIPPLVGMLDLEDDESKIASLYALLNLGIGNDENKAAIVKAGAVHKMLKLVDSGSPSNSSISEAIVANFLGLSASDPNKPLIGSSGAVHFLVKILQNSEIPSSFQVKQDALKALFNLSIFPGNIPFFLKETAFIPFLIDTVGDMEVSERALSILSNVAWVREGRKAINSAPDAFPILMDVLSWNDSPGCQEKASYILMVMAHKSVADRQTMIDAGMGSALLELALLGSALAQKRAARILECLRVDKGKQVSKSLQEGNLGTWAVSAPICGSSLGSNYCLEEGEAEEEKERMSEEKKAVKQLVEQSLESNMKRIAKRANLAQDLDPKLLTSKSLPLCQIQANKLL